MSFPENANAHSSSDVPDGSMADAFKTDLKITSAPASPVLSPKTGLIHGSPSSSSSSPTTSSIPPLTSNTENNNTLSDDIEGTTAENTMKNRKMSHNDLEVQHLKEELLDCAREVDEVKFGSNKKPSRSHSRRSSVAQILSLDSSNNFDSDVPATSFVTAPTTTTTTTTNTDNTHKNAMFTLSPTPTNSGATSGASTGTTTPNVLDTNTSSYGGTGVPGNTFSGNSLASIMSNGGLSSATNSNNNSQLEMKTKFPRVPHFHHSSHLNKQFTVDPQLYEHYHHHHQQQQSRTGEEISYSSADLRKSSSVNGESRRTKSHAQLSETAHGVRLLSKDIFNTKMTLEVENLMIVTKHYDDSLIYLTRDLVEHIFVTYPNINIYLEKSMFYGNELFQLEDICKDICKDYSNSADCEKKNECLDSKPKQNGILKNKTKRASIAEGKTPQTFEERVKYWDLPFIQENSELFDLVITLGGDGTVLYVSNLFQKSVPPVMSFALGSLGFLTNFKFEKRLNSLRKILKHKVRTKMRMRLSCTLYKKGGRKILERQVLNELTIDRGPSPFISNLELYGDDSLLTVAQADGLIIATPTGSTAYSLSAGGSLVYPSVNALVVTPICAHTLSFRPIILPDSMVLKVKVPQDSRSTAWAAFDGKNREELLKGDYIVIKASQYSFPTVEARPTEFIDSISRSLNWNQREPQKSFSHMLSDKNKSRYENDVMQNKVKLEDANGARSLLAKRSRDLEDSMTDYSSGSSSEDEADENDYACV
ncbi:hypothetical protein ACO0QE_003906 [Hanseniaspora vineae]